MNAELKEYLNIIDQYRKMRGLPPLEKGDPVKVLELIDKVSTTDLIFPEEYKEFLLQYDGFDFLGIMIYAAETRPGIHPDSDVYGFVEINSNLKDEYFIMEDETTCFGESDLEACTFFGESGMDIFIYDSKQRQFCIADRMSMEHNERFDTLNDLLLFVFGPEVEDLKELIAEKRATA